MARERSNEGWWERTQEVAGEYPYVCIVVEKERIEGRTAPLKAGSGVNPTAYQPVRSLVFFLVNKHVSAP